MSLKRCGGCQLEKEITEFGKVSARRDGLNCYCLMCAREKSRINYNGNLEYRQKHWEKHLIRRYGINNDDREYLLRIQNMRCALCFKTETEYQKRLHVDHEHSAFGAESVRGLLCDWCNGYFLTFVEKQPHLMNDFVRAYLSHRPLLERVNENNSAIV